MPSAILLTGSVLLGRLNRSEVASGFEDWNWVFFLHHHNIVFLFREIKRTGVCFNRTAIVIVIKPKSFHRKRILFQKHLQHLLHQETNCCYNESSDHHRGREPQSCICPSSPAQLLLKSLTFSRRKKLRLKFSHNHRHKLLLVAQTQEMHRQIKCRQCTDCFSITQSNSLENGAVQEGPALLIVLICMANRQP